MALYKYVSTIIATKQFQLSNSELDFTPIPYFLAEKIVVCSAVQIAKPLPRICFLSGLSGEEMMMLIDDFPETGASHNNSTFGVHYPKLPSSHCYFGFLQD